MLKKRVDAKLDINILEKYKSCKKLTQAANSFVEVKAKVGLSN